jgi:very-short-patch-repair endonuclease
MMAWNRERNQLASASAARNALHLRKSMTDSEKKLWNCLRYDLDMPTGAHFRRQFALGDYIVDFICLQYRLVIEVDGPIHTAEHQARRDAAKDDFLKREGFTILRFTNDEVMLGRSAVLHSVAKALAAATPIRPLTRTPSPQGGRLEPHA